MSKGPENSVQPVLDPDELPDGVVVADGSGTLVLANDVAQRLLGLAADSATRSLQSILGLPDLDALCEPGEHLLTLPGDRRILVRARAVRASGNGGAAGLESDTELQRLVVLLRDADSGGLGPQGRGSAELNEQASLVAIVAHELRSPLTSVRGFTSTLLAKWERFTDEQRRLMLETVAADADRLGRMLTELLDVARIETGWLEVRREPTDLGEVLERYAERLLAANTGANAAAERVALDLEASLPRVWVDPDRFERIVINLVENGLRHGQGTVTVRLATSPLGVAVLVDDEGDGIALEDRERVFDRFWRKGRRSSGTGLGLYIVRGLVEAHGGTVSVETAPTGGARFRVELPIGRPEILDE